MKVEVREVEHVYGETSPSGDTTRTDKSFQLGAEIDGVWVPFATVNQSQLDHAAQRHEVEQQKSGKASGSGSGSGGSSKSES